MPVPISTLPTLGWTLAEWRSHQRSQAKQASDTLQQLLLYLQKEKHPSWLYIASSKYVLQQLSNMQSNIAKYPYFGVPIAVKDNIDVADQPTTCGCPSFSYVPTLNAKCVQALMDLGFIVLGKTNMDQFATGLVGTRCATPVPNPFNQNRISGGSSSGSAYVVSVGWVPIALATDTAGSGRIPAAFNNIIGLKPSFGWISTEGVVPACLSLDCVAVFGLALKDIMDVFCLLSPSFRMESKLNQWQIAVPSNLVDNADEIYANAFQNCLQQWSKLPEVNLVPCDFTHLHQLANYLYDGPHLVERWEVVKNHIKKNGEQGIHPSILEVFKDVTKYSASDIFQGLHSIESLKQKIHEDLRHFQAILVPTSLFPPFLITEVDENNLELNRKLGSYTNFVNLAGWCGLSIPAGFLLYNGEKLPFGITLLAFKGRESWLLHLSRLWLIPLEMDAKEGALNRKTFFSNAQIELELLRGMPTASPYQPRSSEKYGKRQLGALDRHTHEFDIIPAPTQEVSTVRLAVVGAHMKGLSLHHELEEVEAQFYGYSKTSPHYKLFCLKEQSKPGLVRVNTSGYSIQVEVYTLPLIQLGFFLTKIKPPLTLGTIELAGGEKCFGFLCESYAGTHDISSFGGWRNYLNLEGSRVEVTRLFSSVLVANRGEIAVRCIKTLKKMGIRSIAVYTEPDQFSMHVKHADEAISIRSYTDMDDLIKAAQGAEAIFSGYGFLSESPTFAAKCEESGKTFIGPTSSQIQAFALKHTARTFADRAKVPRIPGSKNVLESLDDAIKEAKTLGYPCLLKSTAGGGGIGLHVCESEEELRRHYSSVNILAQNFFNDGRLFLEKYIPTSRHVEVQIFGDGKGKVICLGDRDCSMQRRHQKIIEECPAPGLSEETRKKLYQASVSLLELVDYRGPGTVEFLYRHETQEFFFLEVNTRLQVEHPITEMVHGIDLVEWMIQIACGIYPEKWTLDPLRPHGHAIEARIYAENPVNGFSPSTGVINELKWPLSIEKGQDPDSRVDTWVEKGTEITMNFDPLLAKFIVKGKDRSSALEKLKKKLSQIVLSGIHTNLLFLQSLLSSPVFAEVKSLSTTGLNNFDFHSFGIQVLEPGIQTTIQDYPGRIGYWDIGVPPSGPMDPYAFQMANALVGNDDRGLSGLECVIRGPTIKFQQYSIIAITGPIKSVKVSGKSFASWTPIPVKPGDVVEIGNVNAKGCRVYLAFYGGLKVPKILNSASTFMLGKMGGNANGRPLIKGDWLTLNELGAQPITHLPLDALHPSLLPTYSNHYTIAVMMGPHSAPDYLTPQGIETFLSTHWTVDYNSNRLGIRFNGSKPLFTRRDGGEAGLHPSNIHDCPYAIGSINLSGDVPALLTVDGPSLGGFICPVTVCQAEFWKVGQLRPGHTVEFQLVSYKQANILLEAQRGVISQPPSLNFEKDFLFYEPKKKNNLTEWSLFPSILRQGQTRSDPVLPYMIRQAGDEAILIEFGDRDADFDMFFRFYVQAFCLQLETHKLHEDGIGTLVTGVRSVQVQFHRPMNQAILLKLCALILSTLELPATLPSRIVYLPFYFDDPYSKLAVERYMETVVSDAPWLPSNIEFLRRANGLDNHLEVRSHILDSTYLVLGLGDVYLGSPCAVPLDPKHRLLGTKYSPARTYTPEGSVGIGGMYMCIYGMEGSPGGYQLVGRTLPIWQQHLQSPLLQCFDQIRFFLVEDKEEFEKCRKNAAHGLYQPYIQSTIFSLSYYQAQTSQSALLSAGKLQKQLKAFEVEVDSWKLKTNDCNIVEKLEENEKKKLLTNLNAWNAIELAQHRSDIHLVKCNMASRVWKVLVQPNQRVKSGDTLVVVEAMKAEVALTAPVLGTVAHLLCKEGDLLEADQVLIILETQQDRENSTDKK